MAVGLAAAVLVVGWYVQDALERIIYVQFTLAERADARVSFLEPTGGSAVGDLEHLPGVLLAEPLRVIPARISAGHRERRTAVTGLPIDGRLRRLVGMDGEVTPVPERGVVLTAKLAELLHVAPGDELRISALEGTRPTRRLTVTALVRELNGTAVYASLSRRIASWASRTRSRVPISWSIRGPWTRCCGACARCRGWPE